MNDLAEFWERECAVAALTNHSVCPVYGMPCWTCLVLHLLTGTVRSIAHDRFDRFHRTLVDWKDSRVALLYAGLHWRLLCPHHYDAGSMFYQHREQYWATAEASELTSTPVTPAKEGERGTSRPSISTTHDADGEAPCLPLAP